MRTINIPLNLRRLSLLILLSLAIPVALLSQVAHAAGDASFLLSPSSGAYTVGGTFTMTVYETSQVSDNVEGVQANLTYNAADLRCDSVSVTGTPFTFLGQDSCSGGTISIGEASGSTVSGQQLVGTVNFTVLSAGSVSVGITTGSDIKDSSESSVWNGANTAAGFTFSNPAPSGGGTTGGTSGTSGTSGGGTKGTKTPVASGSTNKNSGSNSGPAHPKTSTTPTQSKTSTTPAPTPTSQSNNAAATVLTVMVTDTGGKPIAHAKVVIANRYSEYTGSQGKAGFSNLPSGTYGVTVSAPGQKVSQSKVTLMPNENKQISLKLASTTSSTALAVLIGAIAIVLMGAIFSLVHLIRRRSGVERFRLKGTITPGIVLGGTDSTPAPASPLQNNGTGIGPITDTPPAQNPPSLQSSNANVVAPQVVPSGTLAAPPEDKPPLG